MVKSPRGQESLLVFSDVHLGSDLNDCGPATLRRTSSIDADLIALLAHYRSEPAPNGLWRVVIAGDFIDFIGMSITSAGDLATPLTDEERAHGLGSGEDHSREKLRRVAIRHAEVFAELAAFVAGGHALTLIHGNHDIELHWDGVKQDFRDVLLRHAEAAGPVDRDAFLSRIEFQPWFFYRDGVAYIEHGHQYDPFCSTAHVMAPLSPLDPRRVARGFSDVLLRYVVRPTRGMTEHGHERFGMAHYIAFGIQLGISGMVRLGVRFVRAIIELFRLRSAHLSQASHRLRVEHEKRIGQLARVTRVGKKRLKKLLSLQALPITTTVSGIMASLLLDRIALTIGGILAMAAVAIAASFYPLVLFALAAVLAAWVLVHRQLARRRTVDPAATMVERAAQLSRLFPAAFVVMGHTHVPVERPAGDATYINLGSWAEEEPVEGAAPMETPTRAARTHVVIHIDESGPKAHLRTWDPLARTVRATSTQ